MARASVADMIAPFEVLPAQGLSEGKPIVARLIGRRFEQLFDGRFEKPFDGELGKMMVKTLSHLCATLGATFGYAERHEISLAVGADNHRESLSRRRADAGPTTNCRWMPLVRTASATMRVASGRAALRRRKRPLIRG